MRKLLMFLVEKLTKEMNASSSGAGDQAELGANKTKNLKMIIAQQLNKELNKIWIPPYCKLNGLRVQEDNSFVKEVVELKKNFY